MHLEHVDHKGDKNNGRDQVLPRQRVHANFHFCARHLKRTVPEFCLHHFIVAFLLCLHPSVVHVPFPCCCVLASEYVASAAVCMFVSEYMAWAVAQHCSIRSTLQHCITQSGLYQLRPSSVVRKMSSCKASSPSLSPSLITSHSTMSNNSM